MIYHYLNGGVVAYGSSASQYALDNQGRLYALQGGVLTVAATSQSTPLQIATGVTQMIVNAAGEVVILEGPHDYQYFGGATSASGSDPSAQYVMDDAGRLFMVRAGHAFRAVRQRRQFPKM